MRRTTAVMLLLLLALAFCVAATAAAKSKKPAADAAAGDADSDERNATAPSSQNNQQQQQEPPSQPPSYALHADAHRTRAPPRAPLAPDAPASLEPVAPTSAPPSDAARSSGEKDHAVPAPKDAKEARKEPPQEALVRAPSSSKPEKASVKQAKKNGKTVPPAAQTTPPPPKEDEDATAATAAADEKDHHEVSVKKNDDDDAGDRIIEGDDPHSLPIPKRMSSSAHFPEPHDPLIHVTPPPSGGWRAGTLRDRADQEQAHREEEQKRQRKAKAKAKAKAAAADAGTGKNDDASAESNDDNKDDNDDVDEQQQKKQEQRGSNSYISTKGPPSSAFLRNQSQWYDPPSLHGPVPRVDAANYKPGPSPAYWEPDAVHIALLEERHRHLHTKHAKRKGSRAARTTRLAALDPGSRIVEIRENGMLFVEGEPFWIQGICYSPVPIGESVSFTPKGDYFTPDYAYIWQRDLPLIKAMGATTIRIYGWKADADHTMFLDAVHAAGLKVLVTFYLGDAEQNPVFTQDQRNQLIIDFVHQVNLYRDHPGILMWSFGNELNGAWNGFAKEFSDAFGCWWQAGCAGYSDTNSDCHWQSTCMYYQMFSWINAACRAAKMVTTRPIISGFADVDYMVGPTPWLDKVARFNYVLPDMDAWAVQLYRGWSFGGYFQMYRGESSKPMIVTEFGVDAYNDACGWPERNQGGCFNMVGEPAGGAEDNGHFWGCADGGECAKPGVVSQSEWDVRLAQELMNQYIDRGGIVWGGFLMAWTDEFWKGGGTQDLCAYPCKTWDADYCRGPGIQLYKPGGGAMCSWKAHFTCPNFDTNYHDLCGYWLAAAPDNYVNEEWFGITTPSSCGLHKVNPDGVDGGYHLDTIYVRPAYINMMQLWTGHSEVDTSHMSCANLRPCWFCAISHSMEDLEDGACALECAVKVVAVGPGSSVQAAREEEAQGLSLLRGDSRPDASFLMKYGLPVAIAAVVLIAATIASLLLWRAHSRRQEQAGEPLLR